MNRDAFEDERQLLSILSRRHPDSTIIVQTSLFRCGVVPFEHYGTVYYKGCEFLKAYRTMRFDL